MQLLCTETALICDPPKGVCKTVPVASEPKVPRQQRAEVPCTPTLSKP